MVDQLKLLYLPEDDINIEMNILDKIIEHKKVEVAQRKLAIPAGDLQKSKFFSRDIISLKDFLLDDSRTGIIAEFKRRSPSKGVINADADVIAVTTAYTENGASCLSVLTDENFFGGSTEDLLKARVNEIPGNGSKSHGCGCYFTYCGQLKRATGETAGCLCKKPWVGCFT